MKTEIPVYGGTIHFFTDFSKFNAHHKKANKDEVEHALGWTSEYKGEDGTANIMIVVFDESPQYRDTGNAGGRVMTTIIATRQAIWADTLCPHTVPFHFSKIVRIGDSLFAGAGDLAPVLRFLEWKRGGEKPDYPPDEDFDVIEINRAGIWLHDQDLCRIHIKGKHYAIGSGAEYATGALAMGATPKQALQIAARYDGGTGLPLECVAL